MGFTFIIGNIKNGSVEVVESEHAPTFPGERNVGANIRMPSYGSWSTFCDATGLRQVFYPPRVPMTVLLNFIRCWFQCEWLIARHPGVTRLTAQHARAITDAKTRYMQEHPQVQARYDASLEEEHLAQLLWLEWWIQWALEHCQRPGISNS